MSTDKDAVKSSGCDDEDDKNGFEIITYRGTRELSEGVNLLAPQDESSWNEFDDTVFSLSKQLDALILFYIYQEVRLRLYDRCLLRIRLP